MRTVAFDGRMGASGDMILGALLAVGADRDALGPIEAAIDVQFEVNSRASHGIEANDVTVQGVSETDDPDRHCPHRSYGEVVEIVEAMPIEPAIVDSSIEAFCLLGEAEAQVHGTSIEEIHFHEVGVDDAIADVTGAAALLSDLGADRVLTGPLAVGGGEVETSHGIYPVPPPAVTEIAARTGLTIHAGPVESELLTPTGAAILGAMADPVEVLPGLDIDDVGYGAGDRSFPNRPNVLRTLVGTQVGQLEREEIALLETHVDDASPELLGHLQERLREVGALDVLVVPATMKKSRPGHLLKIVVPPVDEQRVARTLAEETGTLGVRSGPTTHRWVADRHIEPVEISIDQERYEIDVKVATDDAGKPIDVSAEYEDAAAIARAVGRPVREVMRLAEAAANDGEPE